MSITRVTNRVLANNSVGTAQLSAGAVPTKLTSEIGALAFRNKIINGDFRIDQRNGFAINNSPTDTIKWAGDRWFTGFTLTNTFNTQCLSSDAPTGFRNSARVTLVTQRTPVPLDVFCFVQRVETQNLYSLNYGTAAARPVTLSFWVKSSITGTYGARILFSNDANPSGFTYVYTYTVNQANAWEFKTVTIPGNTSQGFYTAPNSIGFDVLWNLGTGSTRSTASTNQWVTGDFHTANGTVSFVNQTAGATWQIAGVQLEEGPVATPFEQRPIGLELSLCQRYYESGEHNNSAFGSFGGGANYVTNEIWADFKVSKRAAPSVTFSYAEGYNLAGVWNPGAAASSSSNVTYLFVYGTYITGFLVSWRPWVANQDAAPFFGYLANAEL